ncbi:MAG: aldo/keto reductase [Bacteriovorax sp.]|nr:aldo/keto reductase [Bacteriovorax sp.]
MTQLLKSLGPLKIAFGGAAISGEGGGYGFGEISETDAIDLLLDAYEGGIRIFDTAPIYGFGLSEIRMGKAFENMREKVFLVSKSGVTWHENKRVDMNNNPKIAEKMIEQSLRDLKTDYIDLYMVHWPDSKVDIRKTVEVLSKAKEQGKIKHIGLCNTFVEDLNKAFEVDRIEVVQSEFNFFTNKFVREELFPYLNEKHMSFMSWGTLDKGILTGRVDEKRKTYDKSDCRSWAPWWKDADNSAKFEAMKNLWPALDKNHHTGLEMALGYNLSFPELSVAICGAKTSDQLQSLLKAAHNLPKNEELEEYVALAKPAQK